MMTALWHKRLFFRLPVQRYKILRLKSSFYGNKMVKMA